MDQGQNRLNVLIGLALLGASVTGAISLIVALYTFASGDYAAAGICLVAAALSFGLLADAALCD